MRDEAAISAIVYTLAAKTDHNPLKQQWLKLSRGCFMIVYIGDDILDPSLP